MAIFIAFNLSVSGQNVQRSLLRAASCFYKQRVYVYGYEQGRDGLLFRCFSYNTSLQAQDSATYLLGKYKPEQYLDISQDTVHDVLNFYFQKADQKNRVSLCRLDSSLKTICTSNDYDANHINSLIAFGDEHYYDKTSLYVITNREDSSGRQFYLSKYALKAMDQPFEYDFKWQYAFERKHIQHATVIAADPNQVIIYVHVNEGPKKGQWILRVNARNGNLIKGTKLSAKNDERHYLYSKAFYTTADKSLDIAGSIYPPGMIRFKEGTSDFKNLASTHQLFLIRIDSLGEITTRFEKTLPLAATAVKPGASIASLHVKIRTLTRQADNTYLMWADLYEHKQPKEFWYSNSWQIKLSPAEEGFRISSSSLYPLAKLVPDLINPTPGNTYGKVFLKSAADYDWFKYTVPQNPVLINTFMDAAGNPILLLKKVNVLSGQKSYLELFTGKKGPESKTLLSSAKGQNSGIYPLGNAILCFTTDAAARVFELKLSGL